MLRVRRNAAEQREQAAVRKRARQEERLKEAEMLRETNAAIVCQAFMRKLLARRTFVYAEQLRQRERRQAEEHAREQVREVGGRWQPLQ